MVEQEGMDILEFQQRLATDDACRDHLFKIRQLEGPTCAKCGGRNFYRISARNVYERRRVLGIADRRQNHARQPHAAAQMVLGDIHGDARQEGCG